MLPFIAIELQSTLNLILGFNLALHTLEDPFIFFVFPLVKLLRFIHHILGEEVEKKDFLVLSPLRSRSRSKRGHLLKVVGDGFLVLFINGIRYG